jgi:arylsulfatase A-like enzyme
MEKKPNVILITIDCLRADYLSCLNRLKVFTPNLDKLAERGVLFSQAISNGPITVFSFPSIFTSFYALTYPMKRQFGGLPRPYLSNERPTLTELLKNKGYSTAAFLQVSPLIYHNYNRGFEVFDFLEPFHEELFRSIFKTEKKILKLLEPAFYLFNILQRAYSFKELSRRLSLLRGKVPYRRAKIINSEALNWLKRLDRSSSNFFLWMHYFDPHQPYLPVEMSLSKRIRAAQLNNKVYLSSMNFDPRKRNVSLSENELKGIISLYEREVEYVDSEIGLFLTELEQLGVDLENSYIILTADHGEEFMEHGDIEHHRKLYDELIHVPLIICGPGIRGNRIVRDQVSLIDIVPTILDLLGYQPLKKFQGRSLLPLIKGQNLPRKAAISEYYFIEGIEGYSYRTEDYKYILKLERGKRYNELYNLSGDPEEQHNLALDEKELTQEYEAKVSSHILMERRIRKMKEYKRNLKEKRILEKYRKLFK